MAFSPDGARFLTCSLDQTAQLWDTATRKAIGPPLIYDGFWPRSDFSRDGRQILVSDAGANLSAVWPSPPGPVEGDHQRVVLWAQVRSGLALDEAREDDAAVASVRLRAIYKLRPPRAEGGNAAAP